MSTVLPKIAARAPKLWFLPSLGLLATGVFGYLMATPEALPVILPMCAAASIVAVFMSGLWRRQGIRVSCFEIGAVYVFVVSVYAIYPLLGFVVNGLVYSPSSDSRLYRAQPDTAEVAVIGWYYVTHLGAFAAAYLFFRSDDGVVPVKYQLPDRNSLSAAIILYVSIKLFLWSVGAWFGLSVETYADGYLLHTKVPLIIAQLINHLGGAVFTLELIILVAMFGRYRQFRFWIFAWILVVFLMTAIKLGARTQLILMAISSMVIYDRLVRPIPPHAVSLLGLGLLSCFLVLGLVRNGLTADGLPFGEGLFSQSSEFECLFGNVYDLGAMKASGQIRDLPAGFFLSDITSLIPQQIAPFSKISPSAWYVKTFYRSAEEGGQGFAFGTIAESVLGWSWFDLVLRGGVLGLLLATLHRYCAVRSGNFWALIFYVWATVWVYQLFRSTTFHLLPLAFFRFLPVCIGVKMLAGHRSRAGRTHQNESTRYCVKGVSGIRVCRERPF